MQNQPAADDVILRSVEEQAWLYFRMPVKIYTAWRAEEVLGCLQQIGQAVERENLYAAGFLAYEAAPAFDGANQVKTVNVSRFPLLWFGLYAAPERLRRLAGSTGSAVPPVGWLPEIDEGNYRKAIRRIKKAIAQGETYQVNYTYRLRAGWKENTWPFFANLASALPGCYSAYLETASWTVCSFSPELFFSLDGDLLVSRPMKGTARRGLQLTDDLRQAAWLRRSLKNRAENVMIVDMVRNDLGRIAQFGSVQADPLFHIEKYPTVWQMTSTVKARTTASLSEIFQALFPAASITGAPKIRTMQIIRELEASPRRIYTGAIGYYAPGRKACFNVAIRTLLVDHEARQAEYGIGGGIVWDSQPRLELEETRVKAQVLFEPPHTFDLLETLRWTPEQGWYLLAEHLRRLERSARYFSYPLDETVLYQALEDATTTFGPLGQRVRLTLDRQGRFSLTHSTLGRDVNPIRVHLAQTPVHSADRFLYHKTTMRTTYERARRETVGFDEALLFNQHGQLTEACIANLVVELDGCLYTPPVHCGLLPGIYRGWLLRQGKIKERVIYPAELKLCPKIFLANSLRGLWEIQVFTEDLAVAAAF